MQKSGFFNSVKGDRKYNADFFAEYFASFIGNGVFPNPSTNLQVLSANNGYNITVKTGKGWINGYYYCNTTDYNILLDVADGVLNRIDRVVLRFNTISRDITLQVKEGTFTSSPVAPSLQRDADMYELGLADIYIKAGAISITQADITDLRLNKNMCGIVHGVVDQVDTMTIYETYTKYLNQKLSSNEFAEWLNGLKNRLNPNEDVAIQLQLQIDNLISKLNSIKLEAANVLFKNLNNNFKSKNVEEALEELFTLADNRTKAWVDVIGLPLTYQDTTQELKDKSQQLKDNLSDKLNFHNQLANSNESLLNLVNKVGNISTSVILEPILNNPDIKTLFSTRTIPRISRVSSKYIYSFISSANSSWIFKFDWKGNLIFKKDVTEYRSGRDIKLIGYSEEGYIFYGSYNSEKKVEIFNENESLIKSIPINTNRTLSSVINAVYLDGYLYASASTSCSIIDGITGEEVATENTYDISIGTMSFSVLNTNNIFICYGSSGTDGNVLFLIDTNTKTITKILNRLDVALLSLISKI